MTSKDASPPTEPMSLLPCPHCGGTELQGPVVSDISGDRARSEYAWISCRNCPAGVEVFSTSAHMATEADAVAAWNRRAPEPGAEPSVEWLTMFFSKHLEAGPVHRQQVAAWVEAFVSDRKQSETKSALPDAHNQTEGGKHG